jgi:hypothetical protein
MPYHTITLSSARSVSNEVLDFTDEELDILRNLCPELVGAWIARCLKDPPMNGVISVLDARAMIAARSTITYSNTLTHPPLSRGCVEKAMADLLASSAVSWRDIAIPLQGIEDMASMFQPVTAIASAPTRCECGVDAAGVGGLHSSWCPRCEP